VLAERSLPVPPCGGPGRLRVAPGCVTVSRRGRRAGRLRPCVVSFEPAVEERCDRVQRGLDGRAAVEDRHRGGGGVAAADPVVAGNPLDPVGSGEPVQGQPGQAGPGDADSESPSCMDNGVVPLSPGVGGEGGPQDRWRRRGRRRRPRRVGSRRRSWSWCGTWRRLLSKRIAEKGAPTGSNGRSEGETATVRTAVATCHRRDGRRLAPSAPAGQMAARTTRPAGWASGRRHGRAAYADQDSATREQVDRTDEPQRQCNPGKSVDGRGSGPAVLDEGGGRCSGTPSRPPPSGIIASGDGFVRHASCRGSVKATLDSG